jgi:hypothetical protein
MELVTACWIWLLIDGVGYCLLDLVTACWSWLVAAQMMEVLEKLQTDISALLPPELPLLIRHRFFGSTHYSIACPA